MKLVGIYDLKKTPLLIGFLIIFIQELEIQAKKEGLQSFLVLLIGDGKPIQIPQDLIHMMLAIKGVETILEMADLNAVADWERDSREKIVFWPKPQTLKTKAQDLYQYGSFAQIKQFFLEEKNISFFEFQEDYKKWALDFFKTHCNSARPIVCHLKNNSKDPGASNHNTNEWFGFLKRQAENKNFCFVLIGNEAVDAHIAKLPNVRISNQLGSDLAHDLALVRYAHAFMGMATGPCNVAILSDKPYVIYKNPSHHVDEMTRELGDKESFIFSTKNQKFRRVNETADILSNDFSTIIMNANKNKDK